MIKNLRAPVAHTDPGSPDRRGCPAPSQAAQLTPASLAPGWAQQFGDHVVADQLDSVDHVHAAAVPLTGLTAWQALDANSLLPGTATERNVGWYRLPALADGR